MRTLLVCMCLLGVAACGSDGPDITGVYAVTLASANGTACGDETPVEGAAPYFRIKKDAFFGASYFAVYTCTSTDETTCTAGGGLLTSAADDGWHGIVSFASGDEANCALGFIDYAALFDPTPASLRIETHNYTKSGALAPCTTAKAEDLGKTMPCVSSSTLAGTLVQ